jgi:predicted esterase
MLVSLPLFVLAVLFLPLLIARAEEPAKDLPAPVEQALARAGKNRPELEKALAGAKGEQRRGMLFLIENMPDQDLRSLKADFLLENVDLAYKARKQVPWGARIPEALFLNDVLAYANVDESRDPWRKELYDLCMPLVKDCKTPADAAQAINSKLFAKLKVGYSTKRRLAQQSPKESIEQGKASCTGLSIILSDACRSVAIPARLAGTPMWLNMRGNHTWVEIWDEGWHFTGACEADPKGLDRGWFVADAAQAKKDQPQHAIYAASFRKTTVNFPLVWAPESKVVFAENVTDRYARPAIAAENATRLLVRVWQEGRKTRLPLPVSVIDTDKPELILEGQSRGETADTNDILPFDVLKNHSYTVRVGKPVRLEKQVRTGADKQQIVELEIAAEEKDAPTRGGLTQAQAEEIEKQAAAFFRAPGKEQASWKFEGHLEPLLAKHEEAVRRIVWKAYLDAPIHKAAAKDYADKVVRAGTSVSPYVVREVGQRPKKGWPLVIAMHGGGNAPKELNDSQWGIMQKYYKDQNVIPGYKYLALRAPNDTWNGFYDDAMPPLIINLVRQFLVFGDVDPDKVYLIGYSHGGYGAFFLGPKIPDLFAAVHASAAAPTDGTISPLTLRNTPFTFMIGEKDTAYGRRERCERFSKEIEKLKEDNKGEFPVAMEFKKGYPHSGLPDRDKLKEMLPLTRNPVPVHLTWELTDSVVKHFFWLSVANPEKGESIHARIHGNSVEITTHQVKEFAVHLDSRLVDFDKALLLVVNGHKETLRIKPSMLALCESMMQRGDPELAFTCTIRLHGNKKGP